MTVQSISQKSMGVKDLPAGNLPPIVSTPAYTWTRPSDWLAMPTFTSGEQKFAGLYAVTDDTSNYVVVRAVTSAGNFQVDWGDGVVETFASATNAQHIYDWSSISTSTLTSEGFKQVMVVVTPVSGNLTAINLMQKYTGPNPALPNYIPKWCELAVGSPNLTAFIVGGTSPFTNSRVQKITVHSFSTAYTNWADTFNSCFNLQEVVFNQSTSTITDMTGMFTSCTNLVNAPALDMSSVLSTQNMFINCYSLKNVPNYMTSGNNTNTTNMFRACYSLVVAPNMNTANVTNMSAMFYSAYSLLVVPAYNTSKVTNMSGMFYECFVLKSLPYFDTKLVTDMNTMLSYCRSLVDVPLYDTSNVTNTSSMFANAQSIRTVPNFNFAKLTNASAMFQGCISLNSVPKFNTPLLTNMNQMFQNCYSLKEIPQLYTNNVTSMSSTFAGTAITKIPELNYNLVTNMSGMFQNCVQLQDISYLSNVLHTNVQSTTNMFNTCRSIVEIGNISLPNATTAGSMFAAMTSLRKIGNVSFPKMIDCGGLFNGSRALQDIGTLSYPTTITSADLQFFGCTTIERLVFDGAGITNFSNEFTNCVNLVEVNVSNLTKVNNTSNSFTNCPSLSKIRLQGLRYGFTITGTNMNSAELEEMFAELGSAINTSQTITITSVPGAATVYSKTSVSQSGNALTLDTTNLEVGMYMYNTTLTNGYPVNFTASGSIMTPAPARNIVNGSIVYFTSITTTTGITTYVPYYIVNASGGTYQLSLTPGGTPVTLTNDGTGVMNISNRIASIGSGVITLDNSPVTASNSGLTVTFRKLNTYAALANRYAVSG